MIQLTRLNSESMIVNADLIEHIEASTDTIIALVNGQRWMVKESPDEIVNRVIAYRRRIHQPPPLLPATTGANLTDLSELEDVDGRLA